MAIYNADRDSIKLNIPALFGEKTPEGINSPKQPAEINIDKIITLSEIKALAKLDEDWDAEDALPITYEAINRTEAFIDLLVQATDEFGYSFPRPLVTPRNNGGIHLRWQGKNRYILIAIDPGSEYVFCIYGGKGRETDMIEASMLAAVKMVLYRLDKR